MTHVVAIVPHVHYLHGPTGRKASLYGAVPWTSAAEGEEWSAVQSGFTVELDDGTRGACRPPFPTREDARQFAEYWNDRQRDALRRHGLDYPDQHAECARRAARIPLFEPESV